jgi:hypothetical protein
MRKSFGRSLASRLVRNTSPTKPADKARQAGSYR